MSAPIDDCHFRNFAISLERAIDKYGDLSEETLVARQCRQMETLAALEQSFRDTLLKLDSGLSAYQDFVKFICDEKKNILSARPYFRERQSCFTNEISKALKARDVEALTKFHPNYQFVRFVMTLPVGRDPAVKHWAKQIALMRTELVEMNMPLAISRARIFWSRTPKSQLSYMDLIQIACEGLIAAIDKYVLPFSPVFRSVAIGRMTGNFIEQYSETLVHFFPVDKRKIYRANKLASRFSADRMDYEKLAEAVNDGVEDGHRTTPSEIADLLAAASCTSTDTSGLPSGEEETLGAPVHQFAAPVTSQPDVQFEQQEAMLKLEYAIDKLPLLERKLLRMKGITL